MLASLARSADTVTERTASGDLYLLGRYTGDYVAAMVMALRATGDPRLLARIWEITELARATLRDAWEDGTEDGHRNFRMKTVDDALYHGNDRHQMDEAMTHGNVGLWAWVFEVNRDLGIRYAEAADFWRAYLLEDFLPKWTERAGGDRVAAWEDASSGFYKRLVHPRANQARLAHYLFRLTDDPFFASRARAAAGDLRAAIVPNPAVDGAVMWKHQVTGRDHGWQKLNYAQYLLRIALELHLERLDWFAEPSMMWHLTTTVRDVALAPASTGKMAARISGEGRTSLRPYAMGGYAAWDPSGEILRVAEGAFSPGSYGLSVAAYPLAAVSPRVAWGG